MMGGQATFWAVQNLAGRKVCRPFPGAPTSGGLPKLPPPLAASTVRLCQHGPCVTLDRSSTCSHGFEGIGPLTGELLKIALSSQMSVRVYPGLSAWGGGPQATPPTLGTRQGLKARTGHGKGRGCLHVPCLAVGNSFSRWSEQRSALRRSSESRPRRTERKSRGLKRDHWAPPTPPYRHI